MGTLQHAHANTHPAQWAAVAQAYSCLQLGTEALSQFNVHCASLPHAESVEAVQAVALSQAHRFTQLLQLVLGEPEIATLPCKEKQEVEVCHPFQERIKRLGARSA